MYFYPVIFLRLIVLPFSFLYGGVMFIRNKLFDWKIIPSRSFDTPVISVGNLSVGGTGKTPHVEYLIRLLKKEYNVAVLSRGYHRKTKGFVLADELSEVTDIGDEPKQFAHKFKSCNVAVDENRVHGISMLIKNFPDTDVILLDDAFQHRHVKPGLSILLTDFHNLYSVDFPLPSGRLREFRLGASRADIIIVTKSSNVLSPIVRRGIAEKIRPKKHQKLFYSYISHGKITRLPGLTIKFDQIAKVNTILLVAGIVNTYPLEIFLKKQCEELEILKFPDHHNYSLKDIEKIIETFDNIVTKNKIIVTTEKDAMRFTKPGILDRIKTIPFFYVPIEIKLHAHDKEAFNNQILNYVKENSRDNRIHKKAD